MQMKIATFLNKHSVFYWILPLSGILFTFSYPNFLTKNGFWGVEYIGTFLLLLTLLAPTYRKTIFLALLSGILYLGTSLYWVATFGIPTYIIGIIAISALCFVLPAAIARLVNNEYLRLTIFILLFTAIEWLRGFTLYGFPGGEIGGGNINMFAKAIISVGGVNFYTLFIFSFSMLFILFSARFFRIWIRAVLVIAILSIITVSREKEYEYLRITLVQPADLQGITPNDMGLEYNYFTNKTREQIITELIMAAPATDLIILPESIISQEYGEAPHNPNSYPNYFAKLKNARLIYGMEYEEDPTGDEIWGNVFNAAFLTNKRGEIVGKHYKQQIVPFGEFVPMRSFVSKYFPVRPDDLSAGTEYNPLKINENIHGGILICYESLFARHSRPLVKNGANLLVCVTNDAWFGSDIAAEQHFTHTKHRSIETGVPIVQVGNTGVSGIYDAYHSTNNSRELKINESNAYTKQIVISRVSTFYMLIGYIITPIIFLAAIIMTVIGFISNKTLNDKLKTNEKTTCNEVDADFTEE